MFVVVDIMFYGFNLGRLLLCIGGNVLLRSPCLYAAIQGQRVRISGFYGYVFYIPVPHVCVYQVDLG